MYQDLPQESEYTIDSPFTTRIEEKKELTPEEKEAWAQWYNHVSNKERWIEEEEKAKEESFNNFKESLDITQ